MSGGGSSSSAKPAAKKSSIEACQMIASWAFDEKIHKIPKELLENFKHWELSVAVSGAARQAQYQIEFEVRSSKDEKLNMVDKAKNILNKKDDGDKSVVRLRPRKTENSQVVVVTESMTVELVPMVAHGVLTFPLNCFATLNLNTPCIIATSQLSGCCLVFGLDQGGSGCLYVGHAQPAPNSAADPFGPRQFLATYFGRNPAGQVFKGVQNDSLRILTYGGNESGYGNGRANVLAWISHKKLFLLSMVTEVNDKGEITSYTVQPKSFF